MTKSGQSVVVHHSNPEVVHQLKILEGEFATMLVNVKRLWSQYQIDVSEVKEFYASYISDEEFETCSSFQDVLKLLRKGDHISTLNVEAIRTTCNILQGRLKMEMKEIFESYEHKKDEFLNSTLVEEFMWAAVKLKLNNPNMFEVVIKIPEDSARRKRTLKDVEELAKKAFGVYSKSFVHLRVEPGSVCIIWWYPRHLTSELKQSVRRAVLIEEGVEELSIAGETIIPMETTTCK